MLLLTLIFCERYRVIAPSHFLCMQLKLVSVSCIDPDQFSMNHVFSPEIYVYAVQKLVVEKCFVSLNRKPYSTGQ